MRRWQSSFFALAVTCLLFCMARGFALDDKVTLVKNSEVLTCHVTKDDSSGVEITMQGGNRTFPPQEIADIEFDISDPDWVAAVAAYKAGSYGVAAQRLQGILSEKANIDSFRVEAKPYLFYVSADSLYRSGKISEAVPLFEKFITEFKNSRYVPAAISSLVDAAVRSGDSAQLEKVGALLAPLQGATGDQKAQADYLEARILLAQGKPDKAESKFVSAYGGTSNPDAKGMALMGQADCAIAAKNLSKARDLAQRALTASPTAGVAGAAHLIIGDALMSEIETQKPVGEALEGKLMDALLEYMRVTEQYRGDPRTEPRALYKAGECLRLLAEKVPATHGGDRQRAMAMYTRLTGESRYRNSPWTAEAEKAMAGFR